MKPTPTRISVVALVSIAIGMMLALSEGISPRWAAASGLLMVSIGAIGFGVVWLIQRFRSGG
jgi:hypothetical protein